MTNPMDIYEKWFGVSPFDALLNQGNHDIPDDFPDLEGMNDYEKADTICRYLEEIERRSE
ncbi:MAG: hypothetical protein LIR46_09260 [Bacteroidota bacterium]|nr:hypothetical protein [Bacteroidota bacterium]